MPETQPAASAATASDQAFTSMMDVLIEIMRSGVRPDVLEAQRILLQRLAHQGDVFPARIPAPLNITEIGGYLNLLERAGLHETRASAVASALGVAAPPPQSVSLIGSTPVGFVDIGNDRPPGPAHPSVLPTLHVRADFATPLMEARAQVQALGCQLPLRAPRPALPANLPGAEPTGLDESLLMGVLGRRLAVFPGNVLHDPTVDAVVIARPESPDTEPFRAVARELGEGALVPEARWVALRASSTAVAIDPAEDRRYVDLAPFLSQAGWIHPSPLALPTSLGQAGTLTQWINLTGLIAGETLLGDELALLYPPAMIARSALAAFIGWRWNGDRFAAPA
ncbi:hypothetical protein [Hydrogenophaga sp.]|uniref:hypothetical protein n=1 Tax=Hydrogenophaga sp. TaxID=1904254 RepID=UPI0027233CEC|nr:hypothetical protein [Hydrogenophaga sp.]MDO8903066.1 hypothetical protein [Hydrogenophaga sp.]